jgi:hypothetical protein
MDLDLGLFIVDLLVAVGTLLLAGATFWLGRSTRRMAKETHEEAEAVRLEVNVATRQVEVSKAAYQAAIMPWLVVSLYADVSSELRRHVDVFEYGEFTECKIAVQNIGNGLAVIPEGGVKVMPLKGDAGVYVLEGSAMPPSIGVGQTSMIRFSILKNSAAHPQMSLDLFAERTSSSPGGLVVEVKCTDATGGQPVRVRFYGLGDEAGYYQLCKVSYLRDSEHEPFLVTHVGWPTYTTAYGTRSAV